jgi:hypothetical protein
VASACLSVIQGPQVKIERIRFPLTLVGARLQGESMSARLRLLPRLSISLLILFCGAAAQAQTCTPPAIVQLGPLPSTTCAGRMVTLDAGDGWASYQWSSGGTDRYLSFAATITTSYTVTATDANGCSATSQPFEVVVEPVPPPDVNAPAEMCGDNGVSATLDPPPGGGEWSNINWSISGGHFYDPIGTTIPPYEGTGTTPHFVADGNGPVTLRVAADDPSGCRTSEAVVEIPVAAYELVIDAPAEVCAGFGSGTVSVEPPPGGGSWYSVSWEITNGQFPSSYPNTNVASGESVVFYANSSGLPVTVTARAYASMSCVVEATKTIQIRTIAPPVIHAPAEVCPGFGSGTLSLDPPAEGGAWQYVYWELTNAWFANNTHYSSEPNPVFYADSSGLPVIVHVRATDGQYCEAQATKSVAIRTIAPPVIHAPAEVCPGFGSGTLSLDPPAEGGAWQYVYWELTNAWFANSTHTSSEPTPLFYADSSGLPVIVHVRASDGQYCEAQATKNIAIRTIAPPVINAPAEICAGFGSGTLSLDPPAEGGAWQYVYWELTNAWFANSTHTSSDPNPVFYADSSGLPVIVHVRASDGQYCEAQATKNIAIRTIAPPVIDAPAELCPGMGSGTASIAPPAEGGAWQYVYWEITNGSFSGGANTTSEPSPVFFMGMSGQPVVLHVRVTDGQGCGAEATKSVGIRTIAPPVISAPAELCPGMGSGTAFIAPPAEGGAWQSFYWEITNGSFMGGATNTVDPSPVFFAGMSGQPIELHVRARDSQGCESEATKSVGIRSIAAPVISAPAELCPGMGSGTASIAPPAEGGAWQSFYWEITNGSFMGGATNTVDASPVFFAGMSGLPIELHVRARDSQGCESEATKSVGIRSIAAPVISAPAELCPGSGSGTASIAPPVEGGAWQSFYWEITNGSFYGGATNTVDASPVFFAGMSGQPIELHVRARDSQGCESEATKSVAIRTIAPAVIEAPAEICPGSGSGTASLAPPAEGGAWQSFYWEITNGSFYGGATNTVDASPLFFAGMSGQPVELHVRAYDTQGCMAEGTKTVAIFSVSAAITASGPTTFCEGGSVTLTASAGTTYAWSNGDNTQSMVVTQGGSYFVTVTNADGCMATSQPTTVTVNANPAATISASGPTTFCAGGSVTLTASAGASWLWSTGATSQSISVSASGSYSVTVTNAAGCSTASAATTVTVNAPPAVAITPSGPTTFCEGGSVTLTATAGASYLWSTGATTRSIVAGSSGSYSVTMTDANGCSATSTPIGVNVTPNPIATVSASSTTLCSSGTVTLTASAGSSWIWSNGATGQSINVSAPGSYSVTVTDGACSATSAPVTIVPETATVTVAADDTSLCPDQAMHLTSSVGSGTAASYQWYGFGGQPIDGATGPSLTLTPTGNSYVFLRITTPAGCVIQSNVIVYSVTAPEASVTVMGATTFCQGGSVTLTANNGASYLWSNGATTQWIAPTQSGNYSVTVTNAAGCSATSTPVSVTVNPLPAATITAGGPTTFCEGGSVTLTASAGSSWLWSNGATTQAINVTQGGSYSVSVTNANGCTATSAATNVTVNPLPTPTITASGPLSICSQGGSVTLTGNGGSGQWYRGGSFISAAPSIVVTYPGGSFVYRITTAAGCTADSAPVTVTPISTYTSYTGRSPICWNETNISHQLNGAQPGTTFAWTVTGGTLVSGQGQSQIFYSPEAGSTNVRLDVTVTGPSGCVTNSTFNIPVDGGTKPVATAQGPTNFCPGGSVTLAADAAPANWTYLWSTGAATQSIAVAAGGTYTVRYRRQITGCLTPPSDPIVVSVDAVTPSISAGGPTTFCTGGSVTLTASAGASYLWSTGATTPSINVSTSGSYSVTITNATGCSATSAATSVTVNPLPAATITAGGPTTFCAGGSVTLTASAGASYLWSNGATTQSIAANATGNYSVTVTNASGCSATSSPTAVTVHALPAATITAGGPTTFCAGGSVTLTASAGASYLWSTGATTQSIAANTTGNYSVTVTNANGCSATSSPTAVTVNALPAATITAGGPTTFCAGGSVTLTASAGASYLWSTGATTQSIAAGTSGNYSVTVTNANGCSATSAATSVTVNALPTATITAGGPTTFCAGGSVTLTASAGASYLWSTGATTQSIAASTTGNYSVTVTNASGCSATSSATSVTVNALPTATITAGGPTTFCTGGSVTLTASAGSSYLWSTGATTQSIAANTTGNYSVTVTNASGCSVTSSATSVTVNALPTATITAGGPTTFCTGGSVTLTASAGTSYLWSTGATTQSIAASTTGNYSVTVTNANGCSATSSPTAVTVNAAPTATITAGGPTTFCAGGSVTLTASAGSSYLWSTGATTQSIVANVTGSYSVTVTNANGCSATSSATTVTVNALPTATITAGGPTTFCAGGSVTLTASAGSSYLWSTGATTQSIAANATGNYSVTVTNASGCSATSSPTAVTVNAAPTATITAGGPTTFCTGGSVTLTASAGSSYLWSTGATTQSIAASTTGNYSVTVTNASGCSATSSPTSVTVNAAPTATITAGGPTTFCAGGSVTLTASAGSSYLWSTGATTQSIAANATGNYSVTVTNASGCSATSSATSVTVNALPTATITAGGPTTFCAGGSVTLTASAGSSYLWSTGATTQSIAASTTGNYSVTVTNASGCSATSSPTSVTVNAKPGSTISAGGPTTFCTGGSVTLTAPAGTSYSWSTGATSPSIVVSTSGSYSVTVTNAAGCSTASTPVVVTVNAKPATPTITPSGPTTFCAGGSVTLTAPAGFTYLWSTGATTQSIPVSTSGSYTVTVTTASGCSTTSAATSVTVNAATAITVQPASPTIPKNTSATLSVTATGSGTLTYQWYKGTVPTTTTPIAGATAATYTTPLLSKGTYRYWVRVTGTCGVVNSATAVVTAN